MTSRIRRYRYPDDDPPWAGCEPVKRHAAKAARGRTHEIRQRAEERLADALRELATPDLRLWCEVVMIDHRWQGATGHGGYWAAASRIVNEVARRVLAERPMFVVE